MKLADWAKKQGISYLTAYRWFKEGKLPTKAYQSDSGTIIVEEEPEPVMSNNSNDAMSLFIKKTVEFSKSNSTIEDFAAYVLSNFQLKVIKPNDTEKFERYSRVKPKPEDIQKHFQQFIPKHEKKIEIVEDSDGNKIRANVYNENKEIINNEEQSSNELDILLQDEKVSLDDVASSAKKILTNEEKQDLFGELSKVLNVSTLGRYEISPQNCTTSTLSSYSAQNTTFNISDTTQSSVNSEPITTFNPTQNEIGAFRRVVDQVNSTEIKKNRRGRKPLKK